MLLIYWFLYIIKVILTNKPQNIEAITATKDLDILVNKRKEVKTDKKSVKTKCLSKNLFIKLGKCLKDNKKLNQVKNPKNNPSYILVP